MACGTVKWFNPQKGCAFIDPDDRRTNIGVGILRVERRGTADLRARQRPAFDIERGRHSCFSAVELPHI